MTSSSALGRFRQPQYTGENRCVPCTAVNVAIAAVLAVGVAAGIGTYGSDASSATLAGSVVFVLSAIVIYLRGYLVPGTPSLTKRYLPDWLLRRFDKHPSVVTAGDGLDVETTLKQIGVVTECERTNDLCLTERFRTAWQEEIAALRSEGASNGDLARILDVDPDRLSIEEHGNAFVATLDDRRVGQWESRAAFLADVAAADVLQERDPNWARMALERRSEILNGLRIFLERCPACDGRVTLDQEVVDSCCRSIDVVAVTCRDCSARVFEAEYTS